MRRLLGPSRRRWPGRRGGHRADPGGRSSGPTDGTDYSLPEAAELHGAPAPLDGLHTQANALLGGGTDAFEAAARLAEGPPVVINKWASWCGPCQAEFPVFESVGAERGKEVAFLGLNGDRQGPGGESKFLAKRWLPFPSYTDPDEESRRRSRRRRTTR